MGAFKYLGERAGNTSVTGSRVTAALKFLNYNANTNSIKCILFRLIMILFYGHPVFSFDNYRFIPRRAGTVHCWPDLVSRIRFSQWPPIQTDSVRLCLVLCIYHLTIRFPPGGRTRLLLARSVFTCYCSEQRRVSGRHNQTKLGNVPDVTTGPAPRPLVTSHTMWSAANGDNVTQSLAFSRCHRDVIRRGQIPFIQQIPPCKRWMLKAQI